MASKDPYYLTPKAAPWSFTPYDRRQAKRDRHDCHNLSHKLSAAVRRQRKRQRLTRSQRDGDREGSL